MLQAFQRHSAKQFWDAQKLMRINPSAKIARETGCPDVVAEETYHRHHIR